MYHRPYCPLARKQLSNAERKALPCLCKEQVRRLPSVSRYDGNASQPKAERGWKADPVYIFVM